MGALISVSNLSHTYGTGALAREVLHNINIDFYAGEIAIIMGPSGGGKTTLLSLTGALRSIQSGSILMAGTELRNASQRTLMEARCRIGFVFQAHNLVEALTVCENVQMALVPDPSATASTSQQKAMRLLARVGMTEHAAKRPRQLSGGQKQRVAIARALVRSPQIIMADEPTAALDRHSGREVVELLKELAREAKCAILLVTHDNRILDIADRILTLEDGYIDESNLALERLVMNVGELIETLAHYTEDLGLPDAGDKLIQVRDQFEAKLLPTQIALAEMVSRRQPPALAVRSARWSACLEDVRNLEESLRQIAAAALAVRHDDEGIRDAVIQGLDFLLNAAASAMRSRLREDADTLVTLTSNHSETQKRIRQQFDSAAAVSADPFAEARLELMSLHFRCVYFVNHIGGHLQQDLAATPPPPKD